jgi:hypothetical protein
MKPTPQRVMRIANSRRSWMDKIVTVEIAKHQMTQRCQAEVRRNFLIEE